MDFEAGISFTVIYYYWDNSNALHETWYEGHRRYSHGDVTSRPLELTRMDIYIYIYIYIYLTIILRGRAGYEMIDNQRGA